MRSLIEFMDKAINRAYEAGNRATLEAIDFAGRTTSSRDAKPTSGRPVRRLVVARDSPGAPGGCAQRLRKQGLRGRCIPRTEELISHQIIDRAETIVHSIPARRGDPAK